ncbi:MAG: class I SAM-dependent methyltransferase [Deltaproteobacteria bacterium]|nr:class I SAM-dependent methyltransferase [Deltaproteobacteria bacterium]
MGKDPGAYDQDRIKAEISKRWDHSSEKYDSHHGHGVQSQEEAAAWKELFGTLMPGKGLRILDAGCGTGEMSLLLAEMGHEVYGIDISEKMLAIAEEKARQKGESIPGRMHFQLGDAEDPPFEDGFFDAVVVRHVLWTLPNPQKAVDSWRRVTQDNGKVIVIDALWDDGSFTTAVRRKFGRWLRSMAEKTDSSQSHYTPGIEVKLPHAKGVPLNTAREYMENAGFRDIQDRQLEQLGDIQRKHMPFWYRVSYKSDYYAVCGLK